METFINESYIDCYKAYTIEDIDRTLKMTLVPEVGSQMLSLYSTLFGVEFIKKPKSLSDRTTSYGFPILMPPNRIKDGMFNFKGKKYVFDINERGRNNHIHGLVHNKEWKLTGSGLGKKEGVWLETSIFSWEHKDIIRQFPHEFVISMRYVLKEGVLKIISRCVNKSDTPIPFGIGFHPYFNSPLSERSSKDNCTLMVPAKRLWELDDECIPTGDLLELSGTEKDLSEPTKFDKVSFDDIYTSLEFEEGGSSCEYYDLGTDAGIRYFADDHFLHWVIYTGKLDDDFVCLEPYTQVTNAQNLQNISSVTGLRVIDPGSEFICKMMLTPFKRG